jgi:hypothetical protein
LLLERAAAIHHRARPRHRQSAKLPATQSARPSEAERTAETARLTREPHGAMRAVIHFGANPMTIAELRKKRADAVAAAKASREGQGREPRPDRRGAAQVEQHLADAKAAKEQADAAQPRAPTSPRRSTPEPPTLAQRPRRAPSPAPRSPARRGRPGRQPARQVRERVEDDPRRGFASLGDFAMAVHRANPNIGGRADERLRRLAPRRA